MSELMDDAIERAKSIAIHFKDEIQEGNFHGNIQWYVDNITRAIMFPELNDEADRSELGWAASVLTSTMPKVTSIVMVNDSYMANSATKIDGSPWQQGDMALAVDRNTQDRVLIRECLTYMVVVADAVCMISLPYERNSKGDVLFDWDHMVTTSTEDEDGGIGGEMAFQLRRAFEATKITSVFEEKNISPDDFGIDPVVVEISMLCAGVKLIMQHTDGRYKVMIPTHNDTEMEYVRESFSGPGYGVFSGDDIDG